MSTLKPSALFRTTFILCLTLSLGVLGGCSKNNTRRLPDDIAVPPSIPVLKPDTTKEDQLAMCTMFFKKDDALFSKHDMRLKAEAVYNTYLVKPALPATVMQDPSAELGVKSSDDTTLNKEVLLIPASPTFEGASPVTVGTLNAWYTKLKQVRQSLSPSEVSPVLDSAFYGNEFVDVKDSTELNRYHLLYLYTVLSAQEVKANDLTNKEIEELTALDVLEEGIPQAELDALVELEEGEHISPAPQLTFSAIKDQDAIPKNMRKYVVIAYRDGVLQQLFHLNDEALSNGEGLQGELPINQAQAIFFLDKAIKQHGH